MNLANTTQIEDNENYGEMCSFWSWHEYYCHKNKNNNKTLPH